jgi:hypothetical protein
MPLSQLKSSLINNLKNIPGPSSRRKLVVFECDDWGGIRTPSLDVYKKMESLGMVRSDCRYRLDTMATVEDLDQLFGILEGQKDMNGNAAVMTPVCNLSNPDFEKIRQSGFREYHYERFTRTLERYNRGAGVLKLWKEGMDRGIFVPEMHGREHLTVQIWLRMLREGNRDLLYAFDHGFTSLELTGMNQGALGFRAEFFFDSREQLPFLENSIRDGAALFREEFGYTPRVFVPSNAIFHPDLEPSVAAGGIKFLNIWHLNPVPDGSGGLSTKYYRNGKTTASGLTYYVRNCAFEPADPDYKGVESTLRQIQAAFRWNKAAIISTHRVNFVGGIDPRNRSKGLSELSSLLKAIIKRWPEAEFMSSADMFKTIYQSI